MRLRRRLALLAMAFLALPALAAAPAWHSELPRFYGYVLGDLVTRQVTIDLPAPQRLVDSSLPAPGHAGRYFDLQRVDRAASAAGGGSRERLTLVYQVIGTKDDIAIVALPTLPLEYADGSGKHPLVIAAELLSLGPVVPENAFAESLPDVPAQAIDPSPARRQALAGAAAAAVLLLGWAGRRYLLPWLRPAQRPFQATWRRLRRLRRGAPTGDGYGPALRAIHAAFNQTHGETLLPEALPSFFDAHPAYRRLADDIAAFFARSQGYLFGGRPFAEDERGWAELLAFLRRLREAERSR